MDSSRLRQSVQNALLRLLTLLAVSALLPTPSKAQTFSGDSIGGGSSQSPAVITDNSRQAPYYNDFLREIFVPHGLNVNTLGRPSQARAFFGSTRFYRPPITPAAIADYAGGTTNPANDLAVMECRPKDLEAVDPELAVWPTVARFLVDDLSQPGSCSAPTSTSDQTWCLADAFVDTPVDVTKQPIVTVLYNAIVFGNNLFAINGGDGANLLYDLYGISYGHSGLGFVVKGSASGNYNAEQTLEDSVVPEYLLRNVTLEQAHCHCVQIPSYSNRDNTPLSPDFVWNKGKLNDGYCREVNRIPSGS